MWSNQHIFFFYNIRCHTREFCFSYTFYTQRALSHFWKALGILLWNVNISNSIFSRENSIYLEMAKIDRNNTKENMWEANGKIAYIYVSCKIFLHIHVHTHWESWITCFKLIFLMNSGCVFWSCIRDVQVLILVIYIIRWILCHVFFDICRVFSWEIYHVTTHVNELLANTNL